ncbi:MAG: metallophosphoesterase, partial [Microvirga sp.]
MDPMIDPRQGDIEDDACSTKRRTMLSLAGSLLAEISFPKLAIAWTLLIGLPCLLLGIAPLVLSIWLSTVSSKTVALFTGVAPVFLLAALIGVGWFGGRQFLRLAERSFWSLNSLAAQPGYVLCREGFRHLAGRLLPSGASKTHGSFIQAATAVASGVTICALALWILSLAWPASRWVANLANLISLSELALVAVANSTVLIVGYLAGAALFWGVADAAMPQPKDLMDFQPRAGGRSWRVAHLSDIHVVGERYGFRIESGRSGPKGNERIKHTFAQLDRIHAENPIDVLLITGDMTDAGRSAEWAEFLDMLAPYPHLAERLLALPGNHDLNVVDRANPARLDLPTSPNKKLRQIRTLSALDELQGSRVRIVDSETGRLGDTLANTLKPHRSEITAFADQGSRRLSRSLAEIWARIFPMVRPPEMEDGLGIIMLNSNAETHFSLTNALGYVSAEQFRGIGIAMQAFPRAFWIVALHHHVVEYPKPAKALSERIGTALVNGSWFVRRMQRLASRVVIMHGHRHVDWLGDCGGLAVVSAPSPVMEATNDLDTHFYIHTLTVGSGG